VSGGSRGATVVSGGVTFAVSSGAAERVWVSIFDGPGEVEIARHELSRGEGDVWAAVVPGLKPGARYGFRADGPYDPDAGLWFDPQKLLVDPYAIEIDRPYHYDAALTARRGAGGDTAALMPKAIVIVPRLARVEKPLFRPGGFIYELNVRAFTMRHPDVPERLRGTIGALALPAVVEHLQKLGVSAVELMPVTAWIDERHLPPLGLRNAWGYNPVTFMALDPRLAPGGIAELRETVAALRKAGIGTILDLVFNHTGESDRLGPTLSLRGLDARAYYRHTDDRLVNDTGTGNTIACDHPIVRRMILDSLRHFVLHAGVGGFRFDLAPILGRDAQGFDADAPLLRAIREDQVLADRVMIAEPWDVGAGGYQLGNFPAPFLEWNDRFRDDLRRFWRGDSRTLGDLATRLAGSSDVFRKGGAPATRSVNFVAAHDGFALADLVAYERKHNQANGENNRDGHDENFSWSNGAEGSTGDPKILAARGRDALALLATLFASRGTVMLTAGDEFGRSQGGNNNAYAQDNETTWLDWASRDQAREDYVAALAALRERFGALRQTEFLSGEAAGGDGPRDVEWLTEVGATMAQRDWEDRERRRLTMVLATRAGRSRTRIAVAVNGDRRAGVFALPARDGWGWQILLPPLNAPREVEENAFLVQGRTVLFLEERRR
jgi:glycogen operon protein